MSSDTFMFCNNYFGIQGEWKKKSCYMEIKLARKPKNIEYEW